MSVVGTHTIKFIIRMYIVIKGIVFFNTDCPYVKTKEFILYKKKPQVAYRCEMRLVVRLHYGEFNMFYWHKLISRKLFKIR